MMARTSLPPGFRFHPTDVELIRYHLKRMVMGKKVKFEVISELRIYQYSPWDLPDKSCLRSKDLEWYFFCPKETKYANGARMNRATECGYWKSTGKDRNVLYNDQITGTVKTLVFHKGHAPKGVRTDWVMYEYRMLDKELADAGVVQDAYVLCKVFQKSGPGPKNGAQYGAPFNEDDYDEDGEICTESVPPVALPLPTLPSNNSVFLPGSTSSGTLCDSVFVPGGTSSEPLSHSVVVPGSTSGGLFSDSVSVHGSTSSGPLPQSVVPGSTSSGLLSDSGLVPGSTATGPLSDPVLSNAMPSADEVPPPVVDDSDIISMLDMFTEDSPFYPCENGNSEVENCEDVQQNEGSTSLDVNDIYNGLGDLDNNWAELCGEGFSFSGHQSIGCGHNPMLAGNDSSFLELNDLEDPPCFPAKETESRHFLAGTLWAPDAYNSSLQQKFSVGSTQLDSALEKSPLLPDESNGRGNEHATQYQNRGCFGCLR